MASEYGWSYNILGIQIETRAHARFGKAQNNFPATLPPLDSDHAAQIFKDPYLFDFLGTDAPRREKELESGLVEYALGDTKRPITVAEWETKLTQSLPDNLKGSLPSIQEIEAELSTKSSD